MPQHRFFSNHLSCTPLRGLARVTGFTLVAVLSVGCVAPQPAGDVSPIALAQVIAAPAAPAERVRWGGTIAAIDNPEDGRGTLEIVARPLAADGRPRHIDVSDGRFIARFDTVLDPLIYRPGRDITVLGSTSGVREGKIGEASYAFPIVDVDSHRYWRQRPRLTHADDPCHTRWMNHGFGYHQHDDFVCRPGLGSHHGPWFSDWPHPFRGHHRRGSGAYLQFGIRR